MAIVGGFFIVAGLLRGGGYAPHHFWSSLFLGMGAFQLFDGLVNHKVLRLHQVRYDVFLLPYDVAWNLGGALLLLVGFLWWQAAAEVQGAAQLMFYGGDLAELLLAALLLATSRGRWWSWAGGATAPALRSPPHRTLHRSSSSSPW